MDEKNQDLSLQKYPDLFPEQPEIAERLDENQSTSISEASNPRLTTSFSENQSASTLEVSSFFSQEAGSYLESASVLKDEFQQDHLAAFPGYSLDDSHQYETTATLDAGQSPFISEALDSEKTASSGESQLEFSPETQNYLSQTADTYMESTCVSQNEFQQVQQISVSGNLLDYIPEQPETTAQFGERQLTFISGDSNPGTTASFGENQLEFSSEVQNIFSEIADTYLESSRDLQNELKQDNQFSFSGISLDSVPHQLETRARFDEIQSTFKPEASNPGTTVSPGENKSEYTSKSLNLISKAVDKYLERACVLQNELQRITFAGNRLDYLPEQPETTVRLGERHSKSLPGASNPGTATSSGENQLKFSSEVRNILSQIADTYMESTCVRQNEFQQVQEISVSGNLLDYVPEQPKTTEQFGERQSTSIPKALNPGTTVSSVETQSEYTSKSLNLLSQVVDKYLERACVLQNELQRISFAGNPLDYLPEQPETIVRLGERQTTSLPEAPNPETAASSGEIQSEYTSDVQEAGAYAESSCVLQSDFQQDEQISFSRNSPNYVPEQPNTTAKFEENLSTKSEESEVRERFPTIVNLLESPSKRNIDSSLPESEKKKKKK